MSIIASTILDSRRPDEPAALRDERPIVAVAVAPPALLWCWFMLAMVADRVTVTFLLAFAFALALGGRGMTTHGSPSTGRGAPAKMPMTLREMSCRGTGCAIGAVLELELVADTGAGSEASEPNVAREG